MSVTKITDDLRDTTALDGTKVSGTIPVGSLFASGGKGADIASAATVVIGTDGSYFDITGTTGISTQFTVAAGRRFTLQFAGAVVITDNAAITLSGAANFTTAAGDILSFVAVAANTVVQTGYSLVDGGSPVAPVVGGGDLVYLAVDALGAAAKEFTSVDGIDTSVYDNYLFQFEGVWPTTQGSDLQCTFYSDDGTTPLTGAVYRYVVNGTDTNGVELYHSSTNATTMNLTPSGDMRASGTNFGGGKVWLKLTSGGNYWTHHLEMDFVEWSTNDLHTTQGHFRYFASTALPAVKFHTSSGDINGTIRMYGLKKS